MLDSYFPSLPTSSPNPHILLSSLRSPFPAKPTPNHPLAPEIYTPAPSSCSYPAKRCQTYVCSCFLFERAAVPVVQSLSLRLQIPCILSRLNPQAPLCLGEFSCTNVLVREIPSYIFYTVYEKDKNMICG